MNTKAKTKSQVQAAIEALEAANAAHKAKKDDIYKSMKVSLEGVKLVAHFESISNTPYMCPAGKLTIGYGHVIRDGENFKFLTAPQAFELLNKDMDNFADQVRGVITVQTTTEEFNALVSFAFNTGFHRFAGSSVLKYHNDGNKEQAMRMLLMYRYYTDPKTKEKKVASGLLRRRMAEEAMYLGADWRKLQDMNYFKQQAKDRMLFKAY
jgi:lysozyme